MTTELCKPSECIGCGACARICRCGAIAMVPDSDGFWIPILDRQQCVDCGKCRSVCPILSPPSLSGRFTSPDLFACWNRNTDVRIASSSGGIFSVLAETVFLKNGVVYGAIFDSSLKTVIVRAENRSDLEKMRGSKYIEADFRDVFEKISNDLEKGKTVLFSGTPCQNAALNNILLAEKNKNAAFRLYQIDFICHGVSSPSLWNSFVAAMEKKYRSKLNGVFFRDKSIGGWKSPSLKFTFQSRKDKFISWSTSFAHLENAFIACYHKNLILRRSCHSCPFRNIPRLSDITLADAQALYHHPDFRREARLGISHVLTNTPKGKQLFDECSDKIVFQARPLAEAALPAPPAEPHILREAFLKDAEKLDFVPLFQKYRSSISHPFRLGTLINSFLKIILGHKAALKMRELSEILYQMAGRR